MKPGETTRPRASTRAAAAAFGEVADGSDGVAVDADLAEEPGTARAIDNAGSRDEDVEAWLGEESRRKKTKEAESRAHSGYCTTEPSK